MSDVYKNDGFLIIDDFLPLDVANKLEKLYSSTSKKSCLNFCLKGELLQLIGS